MLQKLGPLFEAQVAWVPANDMLGSPLCSENLRYAARSKQTSRLQPTAGEITPTTPGGGYIYKAFWRWQQGRQIKQLRSDIKDIAYILRRGL